ncbi:hypothetical protein MASR1M60_14650 [Rhodocyclaceae bacterium]
MEAFVWSDRFLTGYEAVDAQHRHLFELINQVGSQLAEGSAVAASSLDKLFRELAGYAAIHFKEEERLMRDNRVPEAYFDHHARIHRDFVAQVKTLWAQRGVMTAPAETIHGFLSAWLSSHILGEDQAMARQIRRVTGQPVTDEDIHGADTTRILQQALGVLYKQLSRLNIDLVESNTRLETKVAERTRELLQSEKMASIGQLAAGVAHEINNPIGFVVSNLGTLGRYAEQLLKLAELGAATPQGAALKKEIDLDYLKSDVRDLLRESQDGLERVRKIVLDLKDFSHLDEAEWQEADLLAGLESTLNVSAHQWSNKATIVRELVALPHVRCMPAQINQVLLNLIVNAAQAIAGQGTITLRSGHAGDEVWLEVADSGCGMDEATRRRIFDPFFTTKPVGTGTGLGMAVSYDIINKHGGRFEVDSAVGQGTRVRVWLPVAGPK